MIIRVLKASDESFEKWEKVEKIQDIFELYNGIDFVVQKLCLQDTAYDYQVIICDELIIFKNYKKILEEMGGINNYGKNTRAKNNKQCIKKNKKKN